MYKIYIMSQKTKIMAMENLIKKILSKQFAAINLKEQVCLKDFIRLIDSLSDFDVVISLKLIRNLLGGYGIKVIPFMKSFYQRLNEETVNKYSKQLNILAAYAHELSNREQIPQLIFFFKYGKASNPPKVSIKANELQFIEQIKYISHFFAQKILDDKERQEYNHRMKQIMGKYTATNAQLQKNALIRFQEISRKLNKLDQTTVEETLSNFKADSSSEQQQFNDFQFFMTKKKVQNPSVIHKEINEEQQYINFESIPQAKILENLDEDSLTTTNQNFSITDSSINTSKQEKYQSNSYEQDSSQWINVQDYKNWSGKNNFKQMKKNKSLCCRKFLYEGQNITEFDDTRIALVNLTYPFKNFDITTIKNIICSFLNTQGGILYIGIDKSSSGKRTVVGGQYSESKKQLVLKTFRQITQTIEPDIITHKMYNVQFVPLREYHHPYRFLPGMFVIKCEVRYGVRDQIYSYNEAGVDRFPFRNQGQIFLKEGRQLLKNYRERIMHPLSIPIPQHEGPCEKPDIGEQTHDYTTQNHIKEQKKALEYKQYMNVPREPARYISQSPRKDPPQNKSYKKLLPEQFASYSQQQSITKKQKNSSSKQFYFFVIGINEKQLAPILEKKNVLGDIKIESTKSRKLVVRGTENSVCQKIHKILMKLKEKYPTSISFHKMSLELKVKSIEKVYEVLQKNAEKFELYRNNIIRYKLYRDALEAFILLNDAGVEAQFWENR